MIYAYNSFVFDYPKASYKMRRGPISVCTIFCTLERSFIVAKNLRIPLEYSNTSVTE